MPGLVTCARPVQPLRSRMRFEGAVLAGRGIDGEPREPGGDRLQQETVNLPVAQQAHESVALLAAAGGYGDQRRLARSEGMRGALECRLCERLVGHQDGTLTRGGEFDRLALARGEMHVVMLVHGRANRLEQSRIAREHRHRRAARRGCEAAMFACLEHHMFDGAASLWAHACRPGGGLQDLAQLFRRARALEHLEDFGSREHALHRLALHGIGKQHARGAR